MLGATSSNSGSGGGSGGGTTIHAPARIWMSSREPRPTTRAKCRPGHQIQTVMGTGAYGPTASTFSMRMRITPAWTLACTDWNFSLYDANGYMPNFYEDGTFEIHDNGTGSHYDFRVRNFEATDLPVGQYTWWYGISNYTMGISQWLTTTRSPSLIRPLRSPALNSKPSGCNSTTTPKNRP